jgi:hypothetical protein
MGIFFNNNTYIIIFITFFFVNGNYRLKGQGVLDGSKNKNVFHDFPGRQRGFHIKSKCLEKETKQWNLLSRSVIHHDTLSTHITPLPVLVFNLSS